MLEQWWNITIIILSVALLIVLLSTLIFLPAFSFTISFIHSIKIDINFLESILAYKSDKQSREGGPYSSPNKLVK